MVAFLLVLVIILTGSVIYTYFQYIAEKKRRIKLEEDKISTKDLQFIEFTVDMYIKYAQELDIHSKEQHEYIVKQLERIRKKYLNL
jgi:predicted Holliday junction resolvase-like endonuclease